MKKKVESSKALKCLVKCLVLAVMTITLALAGCAPFEERPEAEVTVTLPQVGSALRALSAEQVSRLQAETARYRVRANSFSRIGTGGTFTFAFAAGTKVDVTVECINASGQVIVRTITKSIVVTRGGNNNMEFVLSKDGTEIVVSSQTEPRPEPAPQPEPETPEQPAPPPPVTGRVTYDYGEAARLGDKGGLPTDDSSYVVGEAFTVHSGDGMTWEHAESANGFAGWKANPAIVPAEGGKATDSPLVGQKYKMPDGGVVLTAQWNKKSYTVTYDMNAAATGNIASATYISQGSVQAFGDYTIESTIPQGVNAGVKNYTFTVWVDGNGNAYDVGGRITNVTGHITLTAQWSDETVWTVTYDKGSTQASEQDIADWRSSANVVDGNSITLPALQATGYTFGGWQIDGKSYKAGASYKPTQSVTATAKWTINTYRITYNKNGGSGTADTANATTSFTIETPTITLAAEGTLQRAAYQFAGWETSDGTDVSSMASPADLISLITSGTTLALRVKWEEWKRTVLYADGTLIINELPDARRQDTPTAEYAAMKDNGSNYVFSSYNGVPWYGNRSSITSVEIGSDIRPVSTAYWFYYASKCTSMDLTKLDTSCVTDMKYMFYECYALTDLDLSNFDTSNVTDMQYMFYRCIKLSTLDLGNFDTSKVTNMSHMFDHYMDYNTSQLTNITFGQTFDTSNVTDMSYMFYGCKKLTSLDVSKFDTSNVTDMQSMFRFCPELTTLDVSKFDTSNVTDMQSMFRSCSELTSLDVSKFDTSNVSNMATMFYDCKVLTSLDVSKFDTSNVTSMYDMFGSCSGLTSLDVSKFDTSNVTDMSAMFITCESLTTLDVSKFNTSNVTTMASMFAGCKGLTSLDVSNFDTSNVTTMYNMFHNCTGLTTLDLSKFDTSSVTRMGNMFYGCSKLTSLDVSKFDTSNVTSMDYMFRGCLSLTSLDVSNFDTSSVKDMDWMFSGCSGLTSLDVSNFNTSNVTEMREMFYGCSGLTTLTFGDNFDTSKVTSMYWMFAGCPNLTTIYARSSFAIDNVTIDQNMFKNCPLLVGGQNTPYDENNVGKTYARIDGGPDAPGYFTDISQKP